VNAPDAPAEKPQYFTLAYAARHLYPTPVHPSTITRHILKGYRSPDGTLRKLAALRTPGGWVVTREAIVEFLAGITGDRTGCRVTPAARSRAAERAEAECVRLGL
jgi:hypothetical protein